MAPEPAQQNLAVEIRRRLGPPPGLEDAPTVSIVVPSRDGAAHLRLLLAGLTERTAYPSLELIVVDNGSADDSIELLRRAEAPFAIVPVANPHNESFSDACNQGAALARGELLLFLNNDTVPFEEGWLAELVLCHERTGAGIASPVLLNPSAESPSGFVVQHLAMGLVEQDGLLRADLWGRGNDPLGRHLGSDEETPIASGACMLIARNLFAQVGGFTRAFLYGDEDVDLGFKIQERGRRVVCCGRSLLIHRAGSTRSHESRERLDATARENRRLLWEAWGPRVQREYELDRLRGGGLWVAPRHADAALPPSQREVEAMGFCVKPGSTHPEDIARVAHLRGELARRGHRSLAVEDPNDLRSLALDVVVHVGLPAEGRLARGQLNVLWAASGSTASDPRHARGFDLVFEDDEAGDLIDAVYARAAECEFPTRIESNQGRFAASRSNASTTSARGFDLR